MIIELIIKNMGFFDYAIYHSNKYNKKLNNEILNKKDIIYEFRELEYIKMKYLTTPNPYILWKIQKTLKSIDSKKVKYRYRILDTS